jgi:hypothetical protein
MVMRRGHPLLWLLLSALSAGGVGRAVPLAGAAGGGKKDVPARVPSYEADVRPILQAKCWRCHGDRSQKAELALHAPEGIRKGGESGPVLVPGRAAESRLYERVHKGEMPPGK